MKRLILLVMCAWPAVGHAQEVTPQTSCLARTMNHYSSESEREL